ncbi:glycosyltransferase family 4 protein [Paenibacillus sp. P96]|uniref:Glycosyltransferase family 4 protein n=1 Tax=Paenibacillus zeirhizosphaerae TaxID=2987519 RepID=A0ABT9FNN8_9BACL|nr:glycosyltransferase family 4 protein [Paenibacillus sp. P96]MDP4096344.1 glycosyltransferase family 4 protein [Paenibacillus sp. P96]
MKRVKSKQHTKTRLKIVQVISPSAQPLPSNKGGTEKAVYELTEELVRRGHDVTLFAPAGSKSSAKLITYTGTGILTRRGLANFVQRRLPENVDIIHDHSFRSVLGLKNLSIPTVCTIHLPVKQQVRYPVYVSRRARKIMGKNRGYYVYNGINLDEYEYSTQKHDYLLFLGRIIRQKGILEAIDIAEKTGKSLVIAGPVKNPLFFQKEVKPRISKNPNISYVGAVGGKKKQDLLKHAQCLLFPTLWEEPFGFVMIEAMACGTPVLALNNGSVPEVLSDFPHMICSSVDEMIRKVKRPAYPAPSALRKYVDSRFTNARMTKQYLKIYREVIERWDST